MNLKIEDIPVNPRYQSYIFNKSYDGVDATTDFLVFIDYVTEYRNILTIMLNDKSVSELKKITMPAKIENINRILNIYKDLISFAYDLNCDTL